MKRNLLNTLWLTALLVAITIPITTRAQCLCDGGVAPDSVVQTQIFDSITAITSTISFNKFSPSIGVLTCIKLSSYVTTVLTFDLFNKENFPEVYELESFRRSRFAGPYGFTSTSTSPTKTYGPYSLGPLDAVGTADEVHVGPDTVFNNKYSENNFAGGGDYLGTGTVDFDYLNTSTTSLIDGSSNHDLIVRGYTRMNARMVYYWCPNMVLSTNIKNFAAVKSNKNVNLSWLVGNDLTSNIYEIQISKNSREFYGIGSTKANVASSGASAKYTYQFNPDQSVTGQLYFRIKQTDANGKVSYSAIKTLNMDRMGASAFSAYPNPASNKVSLQFDANLNGDYKVDVTNQVGQIMISRPMKLQNTSLIQLNLGSVKAPGMYYVRVKDAKTGQIFTNKIMVNN